MPKQIIVMMDGDKYPFGECDNMELLKNKIMVNKIVYSHNLSILKAKTIKNLIHPNLIILERILVQDSSLHLFFQYIPIKIQTWISNINTEFIESFKSKLLELADYLAQNSIVIDFNLKNIGMDQNSQPKYFIGLDYQVNSTNGKDILLEKYKAEIIEIFSSYLKPKSSEKIISLKDINPETFKHKSKLNKSSKQSFKNTETNKQTLNLPLANLPTNPFAKFTTLNDHNMKLTFNGTPNHFFQNLPKILPTQNHKIQNTDETFQDSRGSVQISRARQIKIKNNSKSSIQIITREIVDSSQFKFMQQPALKSPGFGIWKEKNSSSNEAKQQTKISQNEQNFEVQDNEKQKFIKNEGPSIEERNQLFNQQQSPRFGLISMRMEIPNHINDPERYSFSRKQKKYKTLSESLPINSFQIHERVNAVIESSKRLISNFKTLKNINKNRST